MHINTEFDDRGTTGTDACAGSDLDGSAVTVGSRGGGVKKYVLKASSSSPKKRRPHPCRELFNAISIYAICISLPTSFGILVRWYEHFFSVTRGSNEGGDDEDTNTDVDLLSFLYGKKQESLSVLARKAADVLWFPSGDTRLGSNSSHAFHLLELPPSMYRFLKRHIAIYISNHAMSDVQFIVALSILLSLTRVALVYALVPRYLAPRRLAALVHSKSTHLLSSWEYQFAKEGEQCDDSDKSWGGYILTHLNNLWTQTGDSFRRSLGHEDQTPYDNLDATQALRLFTAPRYATAMFRVLFCLVSCSWAYIKFSTSEFWPIWVGGLKTAQTKNCWDLSGSVALKGAAVDSDFDNQNSALRYFFLGQAAYQMHSLCFHFLSMALLLIWGGKDGYLSARQSLKSYTRPLVEHSLYFLLTVATYIFSGLRRLGAISIFALEMSSMIVQFLQICINAPETSILRNSRLIKFVHRFLVVPIFVYFRFFVMPFIVQYSAALESSKWLQQIEHLLTPGCGMVIYLFFNAMLTVALVLNLVYLRRLLFHPFVTKLSKRQNVKDD